MSYTPPFTITPKILNLVSLISENIGKLEVLAPTSITPRLRKENKIKTITGTLAIEGNTLGIEKVTAILEGKRVMGSVREIAEVNGAIKVYDYLPDFDYTNIDDLLKAHTMLMEEILKNAGTYRTKNVGVGSEDGVVHVAPPHNQVANLMQQLFSWLKQSDIHPLIKSSIFHYEFEFIHPFIDGNGRIGRLWQSLILYEWKAIFSAIPIESVVKETQQDYYDALENSGNMGESTPFIEFMLEAILKACENEINNQNNVPLSVPKNVPLKRLEKIFDLINDDNNITIDQLADICKVSDKTVKRDISKLKEQSLLVREGSLKTGTWKVIKENLK